jgi:RNA polymerase sigma factor (sigma-70 family)
MDPRTSAAAELAPDHGRHAQDLELAREVVGGSRTAWHRFVHRYSRLIQAVIRRNVRDGDEARTLYAEVLASLYHGRLATYAGRSALSTWLVPVTHGAVIDALRQRLGGRGLRHALKGLAPVEVAVFRRYYLEGLGFSAVRELVRDENGEALSADRLLLALQRIDDHLGASAAVRLRYDLYAHSVGAASGRLLEYFDHARIESEHAERSQSPEYLFVEREARTLVEDVLARIAALPAEERRLLTLRFANGWTARRIAEELGLDGQRSVYTILDRVIRGLRRVFGGDGRGR